MARYRLPRKGKLETGFVIATLSANARVISRWGKRRWSIEAFFKTAKSRFAPARFAQQTYLGVLRLLLLSLLAFILTQYKTWHLPKGSHPAWQPLAQELRRLLLPLLVKAELLAELERLKPHLEAPGET